jgi:ribonuclease P protein component
MSDEAHFPTEQSRPRTAARISEPDVNSGRSRSDSCAPGTRSQEAVRLTIIRKRSDFLAANAARRVATPGFVLLVRDRDDADPVKRLGITVTKKIGNAVVRNRMKRRFRALAHDVLGDSGKAGADHVLIGRAGGVERDYALLREELVKAAKRATS